MLVSAVADGADLAVGRRVPTGPGVWPWHARAGNTVLAFLLRSRGLPVRDIAPLRATRRQALLDLGVTDRAFGYPLELLIKAQRAGWRVRRVRRQVRRARQGHAVESVRLGAGHAACGP